MDFSAYKAQNRLGTPADRTSNVRISNPGAEALAQQQAKAGAIFTNGLGRLRAEVQTGRVMQANNEYNKEMMDLTNELRQNKEQDALNTVEQFDEREQKIRSRIQKKYGSYLYGEAGRKYNDMLTRDYNTRRQSMINYQIGEAEKFNDTVLKNGLMDVTDLATSDYTNPENVDGAMNKAAYLVAQRYEHYGEEKIKQMTRAAQGQIAQQIINRAYANGDIDSAETYIEKYGRSMDPATLTGYAKNVYARRMASMQEVTAKSLFAQFGDNMEAAYNYINSAEFGGNGNAGSSVAWFKDMSDKGAGWGVNTCTKGVNAALQAGGYKPINTWAPTAWDEEKAAGRTFTDRSKLRNGDIVYWDSAGDNDASHVGIYDAKTGMVYQSGTSGFKPISLDAYKLIGFSHPQGKAATPEDRKRLFAAYQQEATLHKQFKAQALQRTKEAMDDAMFDLSESGETNPATYEAIVAQYAGGNPEAARIGRRLMKGYVGVAGKANGAGVSNAKAIPGFKESVTDMLVNGMSPTKVLEWAGSDDSIGAKDAALAKELVRQHAKGAGSFKYEWQDVKQRIMLSYPNKDKDFAWSGVKNILYNEISKYRAEHGGQDPSEDWVVAAGETILSDPIKYKKTTWYGTAEREIKGYTLGNKNIVAWSENPQGGKNITIKEGHTTRTIHISDDQFARIVEQGMTAEQAINER